MKFLIAEAILQLQRTPSILKSMLSGLSSEWTSADEGKDSWSPYDVVGHLVHGEKTDWLPRIYIILNDSDQKTFEPYDRFAQFRMSKGKSLEDLLQEFETLRTDNLKILEGLSLTESDLDRMGIHPELGPVSMRNLLAAWVIHDKGHITQIARVLAKQYTEEVGPWTKYMTILNHTPKE